MKVYLVEIFTRGKWEPTGPNWWFTKSEAKQAALAFKAMHIDEKYRVGVYHA